MVNTIVHGNAGTAIRYDAWYLPQIQGTTEVYGNADTEATTCAVNQYWNGLMSTTPPHKYTCANCAAGRFARRHVIVFWRALYLSISLTNSSRSYSFCIILQCILQHQQKQSKLYRFVQYHRVNPGVGRSSLLVQQMSCRNLPRQPWGLVVHKLPLWALWRPRRARHEQLLWRVRCSPWIVNSPATRAKPK